MWSSALLSAAHMLGLALIFGSIFMRARFLRQPLDTQGLRRLFIADNLWAAAAVVMLTTGLTRALGSFEKGPEYYFGSTFFWIKMGLLTAILALEAWPMATFIGWRIAHAKNRPIDTRRARVLAIISDTQTLLALCMVICASAMARGH